MARKDKGKEGKLESRGRSWVRRLLKNSHHHFLFYLPARSGLLPWLLDRFFTGITLHPDQQRVLRSLPEEAILIYSIKFKSYFEYLFYHSRYRREKLPVPVLAFGLTPWILQPMSRILRNMLAHLDCLFTHHRSLNPYTDGYWQQELLDGKCALLPLVEKRGFYRRFVKAHQDPLQFLIELQKNTDRPVLIVPHLMFFSRSPRPSMPRLRDLFLGTEQKPRITRRLLTLFRQPGKVFVEISQPLDLQRFIRHPDNADGTVEYQALRLRRKLLLQHNRHRQSITGPVIKSHEENKESILAGKRLHEFMIQHAKTRNESVHAIRKKADGFLDEIAARYSHFFITCVSGVVRWLFNTMYDGAEVDSAGLQRVKAMSRQGPLILVPCHKSHIDYLILSFILFQNNMPCPHVAAGKNLSFWPMGPMFRAGGAFFLRRSFSGAVLYARVFSEYIHKLLEDGFNIELFIEGGRSRTGKLLMPKLGFLSILLNAYKNGACEDMIFVPVSIGYDQILEEDAYLHEIEGGQKEPENLSQVIKARKFLKQRYGKIYINFQEPISLKTMLEDYDAPLSEMPQKVQNALCRNLGWRLIRAIDQASIVTPHALTAAALLNCATRRFSSEEILEIIETYLAYLFTGNTKLTDTLLMDHRRTCEQALENYLQRKLIERPSGEKNMPLEIVQFTLPPGKRLQLEYYKNNCIAHFVPAAYTALAILERDAFQFSASDIHSRYYFLQDLFKYEFAHDVDLTAEYLVRKNLKAFIDDAILMPHPSLPDTYQITSSGLRKLKLFARFLKTYFESYWIVLHFFKQTPRSKARAKDRMKRIQALGNSMLKNQEIELTESLSKINYQNGINYFATHQVKGSEDVDILNDHESTISNYLRIM